MRKSSLKEIKTFRKCFKNYTFVVEWSAQKVPRLPELQEVDDNNWMKVSHCFTTKLQVKRAKNTEGRR